MDGVSPQKILNEGRFGTVEPISKGAETYAKNLLNYNNSYQQRQAESLGQGVSLVSGAGGLKLLGSSIDSIIGGGALGGGIGALAYINTTPKNEFDYSKLGIYTIGGAATGALTTTIKNPSWVFGIGTMGSYSTQYTAEGKANVSSAIVSGLFTVTGNKLGSSGCGTVCQTIIIYPIQTTTTTLIDQSIDKLNT